MISLNTKLAKAYIEKFKRELHFPLYVENDDDYLISVSYENRFSNADVVIKNIDEFDALGDNLKGFIISKLLTNNKNADYIDHSSGLANDFYARYYGKKPNSVYEGTLNSFIRERQVEWYYEANKHLIKYPLFVYDYDGTFFNKQWFLGVIIEVSNEYKSNSDTESYWTDCVENSDYYSHKEFYRNYIIAFAFMLGIDKIHHLTVELIDGMLDEFFHNSTSEVCYGENE